MRALCSKIRSALASPPPEGVAEIGAFAIAEPDRDILGRDLRLTQIFDRQTHTNVVENFTVRRVLFLEVAMQLPGAQPSSAAIDSMGGKWLGIRSKAW
jgi:hypothetical protein